MEFLIPKKDALVIWKCANRVQIIADPQGMPIFFNERDGPWYPTLRLIHKYPTTAPILRVDKGAIKFILTGANIMCPGLTSAGARMDVELEADKICTIMAEGKEHAVAVGITKLSTKEIREINKGIGVDTIHYLGDALWAITKIDK